MKVLLHKLLKKYHGVADINIAYKQILMHVLKITDLQYYQNDYYVSFLNFIRIKWKLKSFFKNKPLAYILNQKTILGLNFYINKNVLIPRNETEELIVDSINEINKRFDYNRKKIIFDVCTGSLVIASCLFNNLNNCKIYASDVYNKVLKVAKYNNKKLNNNKIILKKSNIIDFYIKNNLKCDIFICNPPYIDVNNLDFIYNNEPLNALFAKNSGLFFYDEIFKNIKKIIFEKALIIFEIGYNQKNAIEAIIKKYLPNCIYSFKKDMNNNWRMVYVYT